LAKAVVELRRNEGLLEEEEVEWAKMFTEGIYYAMIGSSPCSLASLALISTSQTFDDIVYASCDRSPTIGRLYVPERVRQVAYWTQIVLRHKIVGHSLSSPPSSLSPMGATRPKELGISVYQKDIKQELSLQEKGEESGTYWFVPGPSLVRVGECADVENVHGRTSRSSLRLEQSLPAAPRCRFPVSSG
jgi:hypothetical protein